jgi:hypothetical protein
MQKGNWYRIISYLSLHGCAILNFHSNRLMSTSSILDSCLPIGVPLLLPSGVQCNAFMHAFLHLLNMASLSRLRITDDITSSSSHNDCMSTEEQYNIKKSYILGTTASQTRIRENSQKEGWKYTEEIWGHHRGEAVYFTSTHWHVYMDCQSYEGHDALREIAQETLYASL